jgi:hypothetical protein
MPVSRAKKGGLVVNSFRVMMIGIAVALLGIPEEQRKKNSNR